MVIDVRPARWHIARVGFVCEVAKVEKVLQFRFKEAIWVDKLGSALVESLQNLWLMGESLAGVLHMHIYNVILTFNRVGNNLTIARRVGIRSNHLSVSVIRVLLRAVSELGPS